MDMPPQWSKEEINRWISYHGEISKRLVAQRTSLESKLIPVSAYILISAVEEYRRYPEILQEMSKAKSPEEVGLAGRYPGSQVHTTSIWALANIFLLGRQILIALGKIPADHQPERIAVVLDAWKRIAGAYRGDGHLQAADAGLVVRPFGKEVVDELVAGTVSVGDELLGNVKRLSATLMNYLFLLYFDTRWSIVDTGPYPLAENRVLLVRDFNRMGLSHLPWSGEAAGPPYRNLTAAFVLEEVEIRVNDWGTAICNPPEYLDHLVKFGLFTTDAGRLEPVSCDRLEEIASSVKEQTARLYRLIASMSRRERIDAGAYVYFTGLLPFAEVAGVDDQIDWSVPRDSLDVYEMIEPFEGTNSPPDPDQPYYLAIPE